MRGLVKRFADGGLSRRDFTLGLAALGFSASAADAVASALDPGVALAQPLPAAGTRMKGTGAEVFVETLHKAVSNLIRENKTFQVRSILQTGASQGMCLLDGSLEELVKSGAITKEEARRHCEDAKRFGGAGGQ